MRVPDRPTHAWGLLGVALALAFGIPSLVAAGRYERVPWWAAPGLVLAAIFFLAALFLFFVVPILDKRSLSVDDAIASQAEALSAELTEFAVGRRRDEPGPALSVSGLIAGDLERQRLWTEAVKQSGDYLADTMDRYRQEFSARVLAVFDDAVRAALAEPADRWIMENPVNLIGIQKVAQRLSIIAHRAQQR